MDNQANDICEVFNGDLSMEYHQIQNIRSPTNSNDAATKSYVDNQVRSMHDQMCKRESVYMTQEYGKQSPNDSGFSICKNVSPVTRNRLGIITPVNSKSNNLKHLQIESSVHTRNRGPYGIINPQLSRFFETKKCISGFINITFINPFQLYRIELSSSSRNIFRWSLSGRHGTDSTLLVTGDCISDKIESTEIPIIDQSFCQFELIFSSKEPSKMRINYLQLFCLN